MDEASRVLIEALERENVTADEVREYIEATDNNGFTALMYAVANEHDSDTVKILLDAKANAKYKEYDEKEHDKIGSKKYSYDSEFVDFVLNNAEKIRCC